MKLSKSVTAPLALLVGFTVLALANFGVESEHVPAMPRAIRATGPVESPPASMPFATVAVQPTGASRALGADNFDPSADLAHSTDISLIQKALSAQDVNASPTLIRRALENALMDRRTDVPTAFSTAEMLTSLADNVGYLEWLAHALIGNLTQRGDEIGQASASETAYATIIDKLLAQQRFDLAMHVSDQSLRALPQNEELLSARARVLSASGDHVGAVSVLSSIEVPSDLVLLQLAQYLYRADQSSAAAVLADRVRMSSPDLAGAVENLPTRNP